MFLKELRLIQNDKFALLLIFILPTMIMATPNPPKITDLSRRGRNRREAF